MAKKTNTNKKKTPKKKKKLILNAQPSWFSNRKIHLIVIFAFAFLCYANTIGHQYTQDDAIVITENMFTKDGIKGIPGILTYDTFYGFFKEEGKANLVTGGRYRPFSLITFAFEYAIFGQNPTVGHILNALFFGFCCILLYLVLLSCLPVEKHGTKAYFIALLSALIFAAHPIHTEAVANIKGRDEILALIGSLGALFFALKALKSGKWLHHLYGALLLFMGLMSKENTITFLAIIPLSYYYFTNAKTNKIVSSTLPYLGAAVLFLIIRFSILGLNLGQASTELMNNPFLRLENGVYVPISFGEQLATVFYTLGKYLQLLFFPHPLTHDYYPRHIELMSWSSPAVLLSFLIHVGLLVYALRGLLKKDLLAYGILFYLLTLSLVSNIVFAIGTNMAERLLFMPSVGFVIAVAVLLYRLAIRMSKTKKLKSFNQLQLALGIAAIMVAAFTFKTISRNTAWKDNFTLFSTDIKTSKNSAKLRNAMAGELMAQFYNHPDANTKNIKIQEAVTHADEAIRIHPTYKNAYLLKGNAHYYLAAYEASIAAYQKALELDPGYQEAFKNLGVAYRDGGKYYGEQRNDLNTAINYLNSALNYLPDDPTTLRLLGVAYGSGGDNQKAVEYFEKVTQVNPESANAWFDLGTAYLNLGNTELGNSYRQRAIQMDPSLAN